MHELPRPRGRLLALLVAMALPVLALAVDAQARPRRILSIDAFEAGLPMYAEYMAGLRTELPLGTELALSSERLDRLRLADPTYREGFRAWLQAKYATTLPDVILASGPEALDFLADPQTTPFPGVPVVFGIEAEEALARRRLPAGFTGLAEHIAVRETLELALTLLPDTEHVALVGGASEQDRPYNELVRRAVVELGRPVEAIELFGLPMEQLQGRLRALPARTVILAASMQRDGAGRQWTGLQSVPAIVSASSAPLFTPWAHLVGLGTVGGVVTDAQESGAAVGRMVLRVLAAKGPGTLPIEHRTPTGVRLDGRQLARWGVPDARVPAGAEILFREPSVWVRYRTSILLALVGFLLQSVLVALLLFERRRRWHAEAKARANLAAVARMNRASALGQLVASLAHEINSPLAAVLSNAEAAQRLMAPSARNDAEVRASLEDIVSDVRRASDVIVRIRGMLGEATWAPTALDVEEVIRDALHIVKAELRDRGIAVEVDVAPGLPAVTGDKVQLVQVILNLVINAVEAMSGLPEPDRHVRVAARAEGKGVAIRVEDSGPGVPAELAERVFEPFFTTKPGGLGMGLAIIRSIAEAHEGTISLAPAAGGGAAFELVLPATGEPARRPAAAG